MYGTQRVCAWTLCIDGHRVHNLELGEVGRCGGPDAPSNMQWQTTAEAKAKDRVEGECSRFCPSGDQ
jgi:hypothetical protein